MICTRQVVCAVTHKRESKGWGVDSLVVPVGMTVVVLCVISVLICVVSMAFSWGVKRPKIKAYSLDQRWDNAPVLFTATDIDPMTLARHAEPGDTEGGSASGKW